MPFAFSVEVLYCQSPAARGLAVDDDASNLKRSKSAFQSRNHHSQYSKVCSADQLYMAFGKRRHLQKWVTNVLWKMKFPRSHPAPIQGHQAHTIGVLCDKRTNPDAFSFGTFSCEPIMGRLLHPHPLYSYFGSNSSRPLLF